MFDVLSCIGWNFNLLRHGINLHISHAWLIQGIDMKCVSYLSEFIRTIMAHLSCHGDLTLIHPNIPVTTIYVMSFLSFLVYIKMSKQLKCPFEAS